MSQLQPDPEGTAVSLRSVSVVTLFSVGQLIVLFLLQLLLARYFGTSEDLDVYMAALAVPLFFGAVISGSLGSVLIPIAQELAVQHSKGSAEHVMNRFGLLLGSISLVVSAIVYGIAGPLTEWLFPGFTTAQVTLGKDVLRVLCWLIFLNTMTSYFFSVFHARQWFLLPAISGLAGPAITVVVVFMIPEQGVIGVAWAVTIGGLISILMLLPWSPRARSEHAIPFGPSLRRFRILLWPLVLGAAYFRLDPLVDRHLASSLPEGSISQLGYAWRLINSVAVLSTTGLSSVAFPAMARHAASGDKERLAVEIAHAFRFLIVVVVPLVAAFLLFSTSLVGWLFERGEFTAEDTTLVASVVMLYLGIPLTAGVGEVCSRAFCAAGKTLTVTIISVTGFTIGATLKFLVVPLYGVSGVAGVTSIYYVLTTSLLVAFLARQVRGGILSGVATTLLRTVLCTSLSLAIVYPIMHASRWCLVPIGIFTAVLLYCVFQLLLGDEFARRILLGAIRHRSRRAGSSRMSDG